MWRHLALWCAAFGVARGELLTEALLSGWVVTNGNGSISIPAEVPGHVHTDLMRAGVIGDPYYRFADDNDAWVREDHWTFTRAMDVSEEFLSKKRVELVFEGLDTIANVSLNGVHLGSVANQHRRFTFDVAHILKPTANELKITFTPATAYAIQKAKEYPFEIKDELFVPQKLAKRTFVRKQASDFGWDWGPALAPAGIWKPVYLYAYDAARITAVVATVQNRSDHWDVATKVFVSSTGTAAVAVHATVANITSSASIDVSSCAVDSFVTVHIRVPKALVELWWPAGYGKQPLYNLQVAIASDSEKDARTQRIGFRVAELVEEPITDPEGPGLSFYVRINGVAVYAKGSNWIPGDAFDNRMSDAQMRRLLDSAVEGHQNMVRVWGGGTYQRDSFYDMCDDLGLMVWLDFMHGGSRSPIHKEHLDNWRHEVRQNVRRVASHASLVMYCGGNEGFRDMSKTTHGRQNFKDPDEQAKAVADYVALFDVVVRATVAEEDPSRHFHASCPSNGYAVDNVELGMFIHRMGDAFDLHYGDTRHYDYDSYCLDSSKFPRGRFISEYGWQSYPSLQTLKQVTLPEDWEWNSSWAEHVQHHPQGNQQLVAQNAIFFHAPTGARGKSFEAFVAQTQAVQALCIKFQSEFYRSMKNESGARTMGSMYWQLNDIWQAPSWASIEYGGRWKLLHYFMKRAYAPLVVVPSLTNLTNKDGGLVGIRVVSDLLKPLPAVNISWSIWSWTGTKLRTTSVSVDIPAQGQLVVLPPTSMSELLVEGVNASQCVLVLEAKADGASAFNELFLTPFKDAQFPATQPSVDVKVASADGPRSATVQVSSHEIVPLLTLSTTVDGRFEDNGFLLMPGAPRTIEFHGYEDFSVADLKKSLVASSPARPEVLVKTSASVQISV